MIDLTGKAYVITGATGGIGQATAKLITSLGGHVLITDLDLAKVDALVSELGPSAQGLVVDVSNRADNEAMVDAAVSHFGRLDGLFLNAGIEGRVAPFEMQQDTDWQRVFAVNVDGVRLGARAALPALMQSGGGSIVITSSVAGIRGAPNLSPYVASKHAVVGLMQSLASEWGPKGIRVNTLNPGPVDNRMMRSIEDQSSPGHGAEVKSAFASKMALGRYVTNEECANTAVFLLSDQSSGLTGNVYLVDGGYCAT